MARLSLASKEVEVKLEFSLSSSRMRQASNAVVADTLPVYFVNARVLLDPGATHSFMSSVFASKLGWQASRMTISLSVATSLSSSLGTSIFLSSCPVLIEGRELSADLIMLDVMDFDVILGMD